MFKELKIWFVVIVGLISYNEGYATVPRATDLFYTVANLNTVVMKEQWRSIVDFPWYEISNNGKIARIHRTTFLPNYVKRNLPTKKTIVKPYLSNKGYEIVDLFVNKKRKTMKVHRLVAMAFLDNDKGLPQVNHKNGIKDDNRASNLEWCDNRHNIQHAFDNGLCRGLSGKDNPQSIPVCQYTLNGVFVARYESMHEARLKTGVADSSISMVCKNIRRKAGGYKWKYAKDKI